MEKKTDIEIKLQKTKADIIKKTLKFLTEKHDKDDEALQKYKAALLGDSVAGSGAVVVDPDDPRKVILKKLSLVIEGRDDETIDLTDDLASIKKKTFVLKEGVKFRIKIDFIVQREIVHGLKYVQKTYK